MASRPSVDLLTAAERAGSPDGYTRHTLHTEVTFSVSAVVWRGERLVEIGRRQRPTGSVSGVAPPDDIHRVRNTRDMIAITLHVYCAGLSNGTSVRRAYEQGSA